MRNINKVAGPALPMQILLWTVQLRSDHRVTEKLHQNLAINKPFAFLKHFFGEIVLRSKFDRRSWSVCLLTLVSRARAKCCSKLVSACLGVHWIVRCGECWMRMSKQENDQNVAILEMRAAPKIAILTWGFVCCKRCRIFGRFDRGNGEILSRTAVAVAISG